MGGQAGELVEDVAGDEHRDLPPPVELEDELAHLNDALGIEAVDRLVQHQKVGISRQRHSNAQPLAHAQGEVFCLFPPGIRKPHQLKELWDAGIGGKSQGTVLHLEIFLGAEIEIDGRRLHHGAHPAAGGDDGAVSVGDAVDGILPGGGRLQAADQADEGGLAGAVFAHQAVNGATGHVDGEAAQCLEALVLLAQACSGKYIVQKIAS